MSGLIDPAEVGALLSIVVIDVALAGDNAIVVGMAAAGLPPAQRRRAILFGIVVATLLRLLLAAVAVSLLTIIGLTLAGGVLLLFVAWRLYRELQPRHAAASPRREGARGKTLAQAVLQIVIADASMSLDNVLAIAGTARDHIWVLFAGLTLSIALMGLASQLVARLLARYRWIAWIGLAIVTAVALRMIYDGSAEVMLRTLAAPPK